MAWLLNIKDKYDVVGETGEKIYCPPHYIPHKLPFTGPITDEPCHYHESPWRMAHHAPFCFLWCKHYKHMMKKYREAKEKGFK